MGKTSLAKEVLRRLNVTSTGLSGGYITLDAIRGPIQAYTRILQATSDGESAEPAIIRNCDHDEAYESFLRAIHKRRCSGRESVLVIDEVDAIARDDFADASLFVSRIRELANDRDRYGITFVFVSRRSLDMIQGAVDCSTLAGLCEVIYVQPLGHDGLDELSARSPLPVDRAGSDTLWRITGGHPFLAEVVMCEAVEQRESHLDAKLIESAQHAQAHEFTNQYRQLSNLLSHEGMFDAMCELIVGPQWRPISPHTSCLLKHYGILRSNDGMSGGVETMSEHFRDYIAQLSRTTPSWVLLGDVERQLRYLVQDRMADKYGDDWFAELRTRFPRMSVALDKLVQQKLRERRMFGDAASEFILDYAYIGDLKDLIFVEWERYRLILGGAKADWERRFQDIVKVRNPLAHHRPIPADVLQEAERSCRALLSRLSGDQ